MGTMTPPPAPIVDSHASAERSSWGGPVLLVAAVVLIGWGGYRLGHQDARPASLPTPPAVTDASRVVYVPVQPHPTTPAVAAPSATVMPTVPSFYTEVRRGSSITVQAAPDPAVEQAAILQANQAEERKWRDRYTAARSRLEKAQANWDKASAMNTVSVMGQMNQATQNDYAVAMAARNAAMTSYQMELDAAKADLEQLPELCRKAGCQPGWVR